MNSLDDDILPELSSVLERTGDDFGVTVSSNKISEEVVDKLHKKIQKIHKFNLELTSTQHQEAEGSVDHSHPDPLIHLKRLAV
mmetsp:Transcript_16424/g.27840  ORF Transcript_16424/g.27840 Transcript_16424/m.27840 type:complete len:83 (+) Transcript_16424:1114-1362(+)